MQNLHNGADVSLPSVKKTEFTTTKLERWTLCGRKEKKGKEKKRERVYFLYVCMYVHKYHSLPSHSPKHTI
jgi:hypothetical protein